MMMVTNRKEADREVAHSSSKAKPAAQKSIRSLDQPAQLEDSKFTRGRVAGDAAPSGSVDSDLELDDSAHITAQPALSNQPTSGPAPIRENITAKELKTSDSVPTLIISCDVNADFSQLAALEESLAPSNAKSELAESEDVKRRAEHFELFSARKPSETKEIVVELTPEQLVSTLLELQRQPDRVTSIQISKPIPSVKKENLSIDRRDLAAKDKLGQAGGDASNGRGAPPNDSTKADQSSPQNTARQSVDALKSTNRLGLAKDDKVRVIFRLHAKPQAVAPTAKP
jgi:hypothetical protein